MQRDIIVIGTSAGGFEALKTIVKDLPKDFEASVFIVWHMPAEVRGVLPDVLNRYGNIRASHARESEPIEPNRIYIAPPDRHLLIERGSVRVTRGPKENRFRPAIDPLFRSAAHSYRRQVIGVVLSGALDDGTSGLWTIKHYGGMAVVQDPNDAQIPSMPENAIREVDVDHIVPVDEMAKLLVSLSREEIEASDAMMKDEELIETEIRIAERESAFESGIMQFGRLSVFACPDCHGVMNELRDGGRSRYRCHTGHAYSTDALLAGITENIEDSLWNTIRGIEESIMLLDQMAQHLSEKGETGQAMLYIRKSREARERIGVIRLALLDRGHLSEDDIRTGFQHSESGRASGDI